MNRFAEYDRIDRALHGAGVPDDIRLKAMAEIMTVMEREENARKKLERDRLAAQLLHTGADLLADRLGVCKRTVYKMAKRGRNRVPASA